MPITFAGPKVEVNVKPIFPASEESSQQHDVDFDLINCFPVGDVNVVDDVETKMTGIEVNGDDSYIEFPMQVEERCLALQLKNLDRFTKLVIRVHDNAGKNRTFVMSNKRTTVHLKNSVCQLPMEMGIGWQYFNIDLHDITAKCFGTDYVYISNVMIYGSTRIGKIYFQDREYSDLELPPFLRLLPSL